MPAVVSSISWRMDGTGLFAGTLGDGVHELFLSTGRIAGPKNRSTVRAIALSPDSRYVAAAFENGSIAIVSLREAPHNVIKYLTGHTGPALAIAWSPDSTKLASGSSDMTVRCLGRGNRSNHSPAPSRRCRDKGPLGTHERPAPGYRVHR